MDLSRAWSEPADDKDGATQTTSVLVGGQDTKIRSTGQTPVRFMIRHQPEIGLNPFLYTVCGRGTFGLLTSTCIRSTATPELIDGGEY